MKPFLESGLLFEFSEAAWSNLLEFDKTKDFQNAKDALRGTKGVDFTGVLNNETLVFMEVKNFRGYRIENKPRLENGDDHIWLEAAQKMRDSVSVVVGSARNSTHSKTDWQRYTEFLSNEKKAIRFVLWVEQDMPPQKFKANRKWDRHEVDNRRDLKRCLGWLTKKVDIACIEDNPFPDALTVTYQ